MKFENLDWYNSILFLEKFSGNAQYLNQNTRTENNNIINQVKSKSDNKEAVPSYHITGVFQPNNETLLEYFQSRGISKEIVTAYLKQVHYERYREDGTPIKLFGFGMKNVEGGYSLRTNQIKTIVGNGGYSHIQKCKEPANKLVVVEGMTEVLSYAERAKQIGIYLQIDFICLHSVVNIGKFIKDLNEKRLPQYKNIELLLNGDRAGNKATIELKQMLAERPDINVSDIRSVFDIGINYVDLNFRIMANQEQKTNELLIAPDTKYKDKKIMNDIQVSNINQKVIKSWLNKRADLSESQRISFIAYLNKLNDKKKELAAGWWFAKGVIRLPEDMTKVEQALLVAVKAKVDFMNYASPMELIDSHSDIKLKAKPISPDTINTLNSKRVLSYGVTIYNVDESEDSRNNMRKIINTHFGNDSSPWCLLQVDGNGSLTKDSAVYWKIYNAIPKRVAFKDGKLLAFSANNTKDVIWWDRLDRRFDNIPITHKIPNDELQRTGTIELDFDKGKIIGGYSNIHKGNRKNGLYEEWYENGQIKERCNYENGKKHGLYEEWYENGQLKEKVNYENGKKHGLYEEWYENGQLKEKVKYYCDNLNGKHKVWNENGRLIFLANYNSEGKEHGLMQIWHDNGRRFKVNYKNGEKHGLSETWYNNDRLKRRMKYKQGKAHGLFEEWYYNGRIKKIVNYKNGKKHGLYEWRRSNGQIREKNNYVNGKL